MDLVFEGEARRVADTPTLEAVAAVTARSVRPCRGMATRSRRRTERPAPARRRGTSSGLSHTVFGVATAEPHGARRWRF
jgi:hypothetical protein